MSLFPIIQPEIEAEGGANPIYSEIAWDCKENKPIWRGSNPYIVTGAEAVLSWAFRALQVVRYHYPIYSWNYGNECDSLIGTVYTDELKQAEAKRYVRECLLVNPHITEVSDIEVCFDNGTLSISCLAVTTYGEVTVNV